VCRGVKEGNFTNVAIVLVGLLPCLGVLMSSVEVEVVGEGGLGHV